uniref:Uncharacterized protein n=1 Tax=Macrostomum lignano TaxID=282301 RepID=A0A1I8FM50_9PLAT
MSNYVGRQLPHEERSARQPVDRRMLPLCTTDIAAEVSRTSQQANERGQEPAHGANCPSFSVNQEERPRTAPSGARNSPPSSNPGEGCRLLYVVCSRVRRSSSASPRRPETGRKPADLASNVRCFDINQECGSTGGAM